MVHHELKTPVQTDNASSSSSPVKKSLTDLNTLFQTCAAADWDGYKALPVKPESYQNAKRFLQTVDGAWPEPSVSADPDGEISLEWYRDPRLPFSVSIGP